MTICWIIAICAANKLDVGSSKEQRIGLKTSNQFEMLSNESIKINFENIMKNVLQFYF